MKNYVANSWQEYWEIFDEMIELLKDDDKANIANEFKNAQGYVNGLTDGWFEYKIRFEKILSQNQGTMTREQKNVAEFLLSSLEKSLSSR